jgi:hypothetical protein
MLGSCVHSPRGVGTQYQQKKQAEPKGLKIKSTGEEGPRYEKIRIKYGSKNY